MLSFNVHCDVAIQAANRPALAALFGYVPISQVLLGSEWLEAW
jgi:hypothetical protein